MGHGFLVFYGQDSSSHVSGGFNLAKLQCILGHCESILIVKNSSGFALGSFHQAQLQGFLWLFDGQNYPGFASGSFHHAYYQKILGYSESVVMGKNYLALPQAVFIKLNFKAF